MKRFSESSRTGKQINSYPWSDSSLGKIEDWPANLYTAVSIMLEARIPMYIAWGDNFIQFYNDAYLPIFGEKAEDAIGKSTYETWAEIWPVIGPMFESVIRDGQSHGFSGFNLYLERRQSIEETFFDFSYSPIRNDDGSIGGLFVSCLENTERVLHERRMEMLANVIPVHYDRDSAAYFLKESHKQLSKSPKDLPCSLFIEHDTELNRFRCLSSFGLSNPPEATNKGFLSPEGVSIMRNLESEGLFSNQVIFKEGLLYDLKPWDETPHQTYIIPYFYNHYKTRNIVMLGLSSRASLSDLYKQFFRLCGKYLQNQYEHFQMRRQEEEQLQAIKDLAVKKDEFISVASHELKTPLTSAKAFLQIANRTADSDGNGKFITGALKQLDRLQSLTADLLDVSKINAGRLEYKMSEFDFGQLLDEAVSNFQSTITTHNIEIAKKVSALVEGDYQRLEQVINNLLSNAVKYSPAANQIIVRSSFINGQLVVSVRDFGVGIPADRIHRLFERFYRIEETAMHFQGMGLGLFIVSEILSRHKGRFWIESEPGVGSTFYFMLPIKDNNSTGVEVRDEKAQYCDAHISINADHENRWVYVDWRGFQDSATVKYGCKKILSVLQESGFDKVLNDNRNVLGTWSDAVEWVGKEWFPMMEAAGLRYFAWIYSTSTFSQLSADKTVDVLNGKVITRFFNGKDDAGRWLKECS